MYRQPAGREAPACTSSRCAKRSPTKCAPAPKGDRFSASCYGSATSARSSPTRCSSPGKSSPSATELEGSRLEIEHVPAVVMCRDCGTESQLETPALVCRACEGHNVDLVTGDEFLVVALELAEA